MEIRDKQTQRDNQENNLFLPYILDPRMLFSATQLPQLGELQCFLTPRKN